MYSYEDRLRAVQLYIKLGKRIRLTIRQLGYPTKNALKTWYREYESSQELRAGYKRPAKFSQAQKERAVEYYLAHGQCIAATIRSLGYPCRSLLSAWLQELHPQRTRVVGRSHELAPEAKQSAVIAFCTRPASAQAVADEVGVSRGSLYKWKNQLLGHDAPASMTRKHDAPASSDRADLEQQVETLRQDIRRLQLERDLLKKANELLKKELGIDQQPLTNREKTLLVDALRSTYTVTELLCGLNLPRSSYFYHRARLEVADKYADVRQAMTNIFEAQLPLLRLPANPRVAERAVRERLGEGRAPSHEAGVLGRRDEQTPPVRLLHGRDQSGARQRAEPRFQRRRAEREVAH
jgi:transposase-like protein